MYTMESRKGLTEYPYTLHIEEVYGSVRADQNDEKNDLAQMCYVAVTEHDNYTECEFQNVSFRSVH